MTTITSRVGSAPTADSTKRVTTTGADPGTPSSVGTDTWGGTWGGTWGRTWFFGTLATGATPASPAVDVTARVSGAIAANVTKRVTL